MRGGIKRAYRWLDIGELEEASAIDPVSGCWNWLGCTQSNGYGRVTAFSRTMGVHRLSALLSGRALLGKVDVCHHCDNRRCCNPDHLFLGTREDNAKDAQRKGRLVKKESAICRGERAGRSKLTDGLVRSARQRATSGESYRAIGRDLGLSPCTIRLAVIGRTWRHV